MNNKYIIDTDENRAFMADICDGILNFGKQFPSPGGTAWYLSGAGTPMKERDRECYVTCRMAHAYTLGTLLNYPGAKTLVDEALKGIMGELRDNEHGGWFSGRHADGSVLENKLCYAHAFVILAASGAALIGRPGARELLDQALADYDKFFWNEEEGLSCDVWDTDFTVCDPYRGLNSNMHTVEAFLAAADCTGDDKYRDRAGRIIRRVVEWAAGNNWRIPEHYTEDWQPDLDRNLEKPADPFKPYGATPGHGIEWSRLITQWATSSKDEDSMDYIEAAENLFNRAIEDAWYADGAPGIAYTTGWDGKPFVHTRMHWTLAEAINTSAVLYRVTGNHAYADRYAEFLAYMDKYVLDPVHGSWYHELDEHNRLSEKVWPGKPDLYHALQATLIPYLPVNISVVPALCAEVSKEA